MAIMRSHRECPSDSAASLELQHQQSLLRTAGC